MSSRISVIHLTHREGLSSVFPAQVARPMSMIRDRDCDVTLAVFSALGEYLRETPRRRWAAQMDHIQRDFGLDISRLLSPPSRAPRLWNDSVVFRNWLKRRVVAPTRTVIHCRGANAALIAHQSIDGTPEPPIVFDCRGLDAPEYLLVNGYESPAEAPPNIRREAERRDGRQRQAAEISQGVICVSDAMKQKIQRDWLVPADKILVVPCCTEVESEDVVNSQRKAVRSRLGLEGRFVLTYCGSLAPWQMTGPTLEIARSVLNSRHDAHFLAITTNLPSTKALADNYGIDPDRRTIVSVPHQDVPSYLPAGDVGLLIRNRSDVNAVASPVKFAEYLASGVPVILTEGIGDYSALVSRTNVGCVIPDPPLNGQTIEVLADFFECLQTGAWEARRRSMAIARQKFHWSLAMDDIRTFYDRLLP